MITKKYRPIKPYTCFLRVCAILMLISCMISPLSGGKLPTVVSVEARLVSEIQRMIQAGHLAPGLCYADQHLYIDTRIHGYQLDDYWHSPGELIYTLAISISHLPEDQRAAAREYLHSEFNRYPPHTYIHIGSEGALREITPRPPEYANEWARYYFQEERSQTSAINGGPNAEPAWSFDPFNIYACYKYAEIFPEEASSILQALRNKIADIPPLDENWLLSHPHVLNEYIAGYYGYLNLQDLVGEAKSQNVEQWLQEALQLRLISLEVDPVQLPGIEGGGFFRLIPELGEYLWTHSRARVQQILEYQEWAAPYWHIERAEESGRLDNTRDYREGYGDAIYVTASQFSGRAYALKYSREQLEKYLDASSTYRGDLTYIQNLVMTLQATGQPFVSPPTNLQVNPGIQ